MTDATHFTAPTRTVGGRFDRLVNSLVKLAAFDRTRQDLVRLSQTDDAVLATRGVTREEAVRSIIGMRGIF